MSSRDRWDLVHGRKVHHIAKLWLEGLIALVSALFLGVISVLVGLNTFSASAPALELIRMHPIAALGTGILVLCITIAALIITQKSDSPEPSRGVGQPNRDKGGPFHRLMISMAISTISTTLLIALLVTILTRPIWCPATLCLPVQVHTLTNPHGTHDSNLEVYLTAEQIPAFALTNIPSSYTLATLPTEQNGGLPAVHTGPQSAGGIYQVVVGVHDLNYGEFPIIIEQAAIVIDDLPPVPYPLNIYATSSRDYDTNTLRAAYNGQSLGSVLAASYAPDPYNYVQLTPGETDSLDIQVVSYEVAELRFHVRISYRLANQTQAVNIIVPTTLQAVFSDDSNWHQYQLTGGQLEPVKSG